MNGKRVAELLMKYDVGSMSPGMGLWLAGMRGSVLEARKKESDDEGAEELAEFADSLMDIIDTAAHHQRLVIGKLGALVAASKE